MCCRLGENVLTKFGVNGLISEAKQCNDQVILNGINEMYAKGLDSLISHQNQSGEQAVRLIGNILHLSSNLCGKSVFDNGLEVGCGAGHISRFLQSICAQLTAFDASSEAIKYAKEIQDTKIRFKVADGISPIEAE